MTTEAVAAVHFYVRGLLAPCMEPDDIRLYHIRSSLNEYLSAVEIEARRQERTRLRAEHAGAHPGFVVECPTCRLIAEPQ